MNEEGAPFDSGFDDAGPFSVTPEADGVPLDAALREFGPAAFEDLIPRLRSLAADLDAAHTAGFIHGRLHPSKVFVTADATYLLGARVPQSLDDERRWPMQPPYTAPEVVQGAAPSPMSDQFSLAAIAYEWMFGRPITGPADRSVDVRAIPNVDRITLAKAFTRALTPEPFRRFASCRDFCDAAAASTSPSLPLMPAHHAETRVAGTPVPPEGEDDPVGPFLPEEPSPTPVVPVAAAASVPDLPLVTEGEQDLDVNSPAFAAAPDSTYAPTDLPETKTSDYDEPPMATPVRRSERFSGLALIVATIVGAVFGFAAGYMARPRALQTAAPEQITAGTDAPVASAQSAQGADTHAVRAPSAPSVPVAPRAPAKIGRLLVRSTPSGASVDVDGVARGVTPLALQDLDLGARAITVSRRGYESEQRRIVLTKARPSRSVEVRLSQEAAAGPRPATPASLGKPAVSTGALAVESRPTGAAVVVNGKPSGTTPMTITDLAPGDYLVTMTMEGYRPFATTVRVVAGERARAAARLTELEQE